jgi:hypothetical protein
MTRISEEKLGEAVSVAGVDYTAARGWLVVPEYYVVAVNEFLSDWRKGDFALSDLAALDAENVELAGERWTAEQAQHKHPTTVSSLVTELRELREALRPFARLLDDDAPHAWIQDVRVVTHPQLRPLVKAAKRALSGAKL